ncbi:MAG: hypothetical protein MPJ50_11595 [Pirellulales bacterium]|nr:hypothetical protein [Pirellulales bacterium]
MFLSRFSLLQIACRHQSATVIVLGSMFAMMSFSQAQAQTDPQQQFQRQVNEYSVVRLTSDLSGLTDKERQMLPLLIQAADLMNEVFWVQAYGDRDPLFGQIEQPAGRRLLSINYGPWGRLNNNEPFIGGIGAKPLGANFYPSDMTKEEFEKFLSDNPQQAEKFKSLYTMIRRDRNGNLGATWYHEMFPQHEQAAALLDQAAALAEDGGLKRYLTLRAEALRTDDYRASDMAWLDMKDNTLDIVIGPVENYEDALFGYKAANEGFVLIKDKEWSARLSRYAQLLPGLQRDLPVPEKYKQETPGTDSDLNAYDVIYYAGDCNAGAKTIAINLPNDEQVQLQKGTRRLQLKNAMQAKFDRILIPIADLLIDKGQREHVKFQAFFGNTMFHEVAHGLGIKATLTGQGSVREALRNHFSALEEGKADILGLYMVGKLYEQGELTEGEVMDNYVTFMAGLFRSVRFGASSAHGKANMSAFNFFQEEGAFARDSAGRYQVDETKMQAAIQKLAKRIITLQGDGDYDAAGAFLDKMANVSPGLQGDLDRINAQGIPVDIVFEQGLDVLGLKSH